jgi:glutamyl/glutaminyl-tRNA synthetase
MPSPQYLSAVLKVCHERISSLKDIYRRAHYFFQDPNPFDTDIAPFIHKSLRQGSTLKDGGYKVKQIVGEILRISKEKFDVLQEWSSEELSKTIEEIGSETNQRPDVVMRLLRYAITGVTSGVGVPKVMEILGKEKVKERLRRCILYVDSTTGKEYYDKNVMN